jgi:hypothetical protein
VTTIASPLVTDTPHLEQWEDEYALDAAIARGLALVFQLEVVAAQLDLELPPIVGSATDQAAIESAAALYLASELESTRLVPAVETLAGVFVSGGLATDLGPAGARVVEFWHRRRERFTANEREAFFARLFGKPYGPGLAIEGARNTEFETLLFELAAALTELDTDPMFGRSPRGEIRVRTAAAHLAANLAPRGGGMAPYVARDALGTIEAALAIVKEPAVQQAFGARTAWATVQLLSRRYLGHEADVASHVTRGATGQQLLAWLAESVPRLDDLRNPVIRPDERIIMAAVSWLHATLALQERVPGRTTRSA